jgi:hypothetical protein
VFFSLWFLALITGVLWLRPLHPLAPVAFVAVMAAVLVCVCYAKGEPPAWHWGDRP